MGKSNLHGMGRNPDQKHLVGFPSHLVSCDCGVPTAQGLQLLSRVEWGFAGPFRFSGENGQTILHNGMEHVGHVLVPRVSYDNASRSALSCSSRTGGGKRFVWGEIYLVKKNKRGGKSGFEKYLKKTGSGESYGFEARIFNIGISVIRFSLPE